MKNIAARQGRKGEAPRYFNMGKTPAAHMAADPV
jgi:hypothetical protein